MISKPLSYCAVAIALAALASAASAQEARPATSPWDKYQPLIKDNMFVRDRVSAAKTAAVTPPPPPSAESSIVLAGVVRQGEEYIAFMEDRRANTTTKVKLGEAVARGKLTDLTLDSAEYERDGAKTRVEIGKTLEGGAPAAGVGASTDSSSGTTSTSSGTGSSAPSSDVMSIEEKMRLKRLKELGK